MCLTSRSVAKIGIGEGLNVEHAGFTYCELEQAKSWIPSTTAESPRPRDSSSCSACADIGVPSDELWKGSRPETAVKVKTA
jgi:hypothetical protein